MEDRGKPYSCVLLSSLVDIQVVAIESVAGCATSTGPAIGCGRTASVAKKTTVRLRVKTKRYRLHQCVRPARLVRRPPR
jgi:hypothetical protein